MNISKDLIIVLIVALLIFGPSKLAGLGSTLGKTIKDFRKALEEHEEERPTHSLPPDSTKS